MPRPCKHRNYADARAAKKSAIGQEKADILVPALCDKCGHWRLRLSTAERDRRDQARRGE